MDEKPTGDVRSDGPQDRPPTSEERLARARVEADGLLARSDFPAALAVYRDLAGSLAESDPVAQEARFHEAMILETYGNRGDEASNLYLALARKGHEGGAKAVQRLIEAAWAAAREGRVAGSVLILKRLLDEAPSCVEGLAPARAWLAKTLLDGCLEEAQHAYEAREYARAAPLFEDAARLSDASGNAMAAQKARSRAAAIYWYNLIDQAAALRVIAAMPSAHWSSPAVKSILDRVTESLVEDLRILIRRGEKREAFVRLCVAYRALPEGIQRRDDLTSVYLAELASQHLLAIDNRIGNLTRRADHVSNDATRRSGQGGVRPPEKLDEVAASLQLFALTEEKDLTGSLRERVCERELEVLGGWTVEEYLALHARAGDDKILNEILAKVHQLALKRMHYKTRLSFEVKDRFAAYLPRSLASYVVDDVYLEVSSLERDIDRLTEQFLASAYAKP